MTNVLDQVHGVVNPRLEMVDGKQRLRDSLVRGRRELPKGSRVVVTVAIDGESQTLLDVVEASDDGRRSVLNVAASLNNQVEALPPAGPAEEAEPA